MMDGRMRVRGFVTLAALLVGGGCNLLTGAADVGILAPEEEAEPDGSIATPEPRADGSSTTPDASVEPVDAGREEDADAEAGPRGPLRAFITSQVFQGAMNGLAGADALCTQAALDANLGGTGKWVAWLSTNQDNVRAVDRITSNGPWQLVNGDVIATSKADLIDGQLEVPLRRTEKNDLVSVDNDRAWTGTRPDGTPAQFDCAKWTSNSANSGGGVGEAEFRGNAWSLQLNEPCAAQNRLYCFEQ